MAKAEETKEKKNKNSVEPVKEKEITLEETEDDIIFGKGFKSDPDDFTAELVKEAQKTGAFGFLLPFFVFLLIAASSAIATYYYAKPERSIESTNVRAEDKIQNQPIVQEPQKTENPDTPVQSTPTPTQPPATADTVYTVKEGDTMSGIANKYNMTSGELAKYNGLSDVNALKIGQTLKIPSK